MGFKTYTCPVAKSCGGCEWLAVPYPIQLRRKREAVLELFEEILPEAATAGEREARVPIHGMDADGMEPVGYRHKAATPFAPGKRAGSVRSGFYARGSHRIVPCTSCLVEAPHAREALNAVARAAEQLRIPAYDEDRGRGLLRGAQLDVAIANELVDEGLAAGLVLNHIGDSIIRFLPPLVITREQVDEGMDRFEELLKKLA